VECADISVSNEFLNFSDESFIDDSRAGGAYGLTLGLSGDIGRRKEITSASSQGSEVVKIHCSYNVGNFL